MIVSLASDEQSTGRAAEAPTVGIPVLLFHRLSTPVAGYTNTNHRPPVSTLKAGCVGLAAKHAICVCSCTQGRATAAAAA